MYVYTVLVVPTVCTTNFPTEELEIIDRNKNSHSQQKKKNFSATTKTHHIPLTPLTPPT